MNRRSCERWKPTVESDVRMAPHGGAYFEISEHANVFLETFLVTSWAEHLRQHERFTRGDAEVEAQVRRHIEGEPVVEHQVGVEAISTTANTNEGGHL